MAADPKIISKIQKLLALGTSTNPNEAAAALAKARELLLDYNLSLEEVQVAEKRGRNYLREDIAIGKWAWQSYLVDVVCKHNLCTAVKLRGTDRVAIIGEQHNIEIVRLMIDLIGEQLGFLAATAWKAAETDLPAITWKRTFYFGALTTIDRRLKEEKEQAANNVRALIVVRDRELVVARNKFFNNRVVPGKPIRVRGEDAYAAGQRAGEQVRFRKEIQ